MGVEPKIGGKPPKSSICSQGFPLFSPSILGYPYFWKHPNVCLSQHIRFWILPNPKNTGKTHVRIQLSRVNSYGPRWLETETWMVESWKTQPCIHLKHQTTCAHIVYRIGTWTVQNMSGMFHLMLPNDCLPTLSGYWSGISWTLPLCGSTWFKLPAWLETLMCRSFSVSNLWFQKKVLEVGTGRYRHIFAHLK